MAELPMLFLKPGEGRRVRDPLIPSRVLPAEGDYKPDNSFWRLRLHQGDVVEATPPREVKPAKAKE